MSKKSMSIAAALIAVMTVAALSVGGCNNKAATSGTGTGASTNAGSGSTSATASQNSSSTTLTANSANGTDPGTSGATGSSKVTDPSLPKLVPFKRMPEPTTPAQALKVPAADGKALTILSAAPDNTTAGLVLGATPDGAKYTVTVRPYGFGPNAVLGTRIAVRVDSAKPQGTAPADNNLKNSNVLVIVNTAEGGQMTKGGKYTATITLRSDGTKLLPIISNVKAAQ